MSPRKYVLTYLALVSPLALVIFANYLFLRGSGELLLAKDIASAQSANDVLYGTATNHNTYQYKLELYRKWKPDIVAVGSSRTLQLRGNFFNTPFVTMGGAMNSLKEGELLWEDMLRIHQSKVVLLGLDFWWFDESKPEGSDNHVLRGGELHLSKLLFPAESLLNGKVDPAFFLESARRGIAVVVFMPPVAPSVLDEMKRAGGYSDLGTAIRKGLPADIPFFDFTDPAVLGEASDCEFVDGTHGGGRALCTHG
jgi:hypothetical protein